MDLQSLAAYATILSAGILIGGGVVGGFWRAWAWRQEHGTNVTVQLSIGFLTFPTGLIEAIIVTVINHSAHPVRVTGAGVEINDGSKRAGHVPLKPGAGIPGIIAAHDQEMTWIERAELVTEGFDVYRKARAFARLADRPGGPLWSKSRALMRRA